MRFRLSALAVSALLLSHSASAAFHEIMVKEVFTGTVTAPNAHYVVLQAYNMDQNFLTGHSVTIFDAAGANIGTFTFTGGVGNPANQMTVLLATPEAATLFNVTADLAMTSALSPVGGKVCWDGATPDDCVAWGGYSGSATGIGTPINVPGGIEPGEAIRRRLDIAGSPTLLEPGDDTNDSANDFIVVVPAPRNNAGVTGTIPPSTCGNNTLESLEQCDDGNAASGDGCSNVCSYEASFVAPVELFVDKPAVVGFVADNGVLEPGETVVVRPGWQNNGTSSLTLDGELSLFTGPAGATYSIVDGISGYGTVAASDSANCIQDSDCYSISVSAPATRPAAHWDAVLSEVLSSTSVENWVIHVGESFPDVPTDHPFYSFIETLFHTGVTGGCAGGNYCPGNPVTRAQMAVFLLKAKEGASYVPPNCTGTIFTDVPCTGGTFDPWIEELANREVTGGCGGGNYCPGNSVTRAQMAVFLLKTLETSAYDPPDCVGLFGDVTCTPGSGFSDWIEELYNRQITGGCQASPLLYCPDNPNNRGQMAVFLVKTFLLLLYGPNPGPV